MKSPFTGGSVILQHEPMAVTYRKEVYEIERLFYVCNDTQERFSTNELDAVNLRQIHNQYRVKYGLPFPDEIANIRRKYGLSAAKMSAVMGFGDNQYRLYENGDMPSEANGRAIRSVDNPITMKMYVEGVRNQFDAKEYMRIEENLRKAQDKAAFLKADITTLIYGSCKRGKYNGYAFQHIDRLKNLMLFFIHKAGSVFNTKMNKLLFYTDFLAYRKNGMGISGLAYRAIQYGPVPVRWDRVYSLIEGIEQELVVFESGVFGQQLVSEELPDLTLFTNEELAVMNQVWDHFKGYTASQISEISHEENAWQRYVNSATLLDYKEAFDLKQF